MPKAIDPAFPLPFPVDVDGEKTFFFGMKLRDYLAAQAMNGMCSNPYWDDKTWGDIADAAFEAADAMLKRSAKSDSQSGG